MFEQTKLDPKKPMIPTVVSSRRIKEFAINSSKYSNLFYSCVHTHAGILGLMAHTLNEKEKLVWRVRRIRGQVEAVERALTEEQDCSEILQLITAARGAMNSLIVEVLEGHIREHVLDPKQKPDSQHVSAAEELIDVLRSYLK